MHHAGCRTFAHPTFITHLFLLPLHKRRGAGVRGAAGGSRLHAAACAGSTSGRGGTAARAVAVACLQASGRSEAAKRRQLPRSSSGRRKRRQRQKWLDARRSSDGSSGERYAAVHQSRTVGSRWRRRRHPSSSQSKQQSTISSENSAHALNVVLGALPLSFWLLWQWQRVLTAAVSVVVHLLHVQWQQLAS